MLVVQNASVPAAIRNAIFDLVTTDLTDLRVASAYVTQSGSGMLLDTVAGIVREPVFTNIPKTLVTSFDFGLTEPQALRHWLNLPNATVLVSGANQLAQNSLMPLRAFHPKLYAFGKGDQTCNSLVGSANLTGRGFSVNTEAAWAQRNVPRANIDAAFALTQFETTILTDDLLAAYEALRKAHPARPEVKQEVEPVPPPEPFSDAELPQFRTAIENGFINPSDYNSMWVKGDALQGGSHSQLELPRGGHRFFGYVFTQYDYPDKLTIGKPVIRSGSTVWEDRLLTWHGHNRMERMNLPTRRQGGFDYADTAVMFRRLADGSFELIVTPWDSDLARSWQQASLQRHTLFRLGAIATNRTVGLF